MPPPVWEIPADLGAEPGNAGIQGEDGPNGQVHSPKAAIFSKVLISVDWRSVPVPGDFSHMHSFLHNLTKYIHTAAFGLEVEPLLLEISPS